MGPDDPPARRSPPPPLRRVREDEAGPLVREGAVESDLARFGFRGEGGWREGGREGSGPRSFRKARPETNANESTKGDSEKGKRGRARAWSGEQDAWMATLGSPLAAALETHRPLCVPKVGKGGDGDKNTKKGTHTQKGGSKSGPKATQKASPAGKRKTEKGVINRPVAAVADEDEEPPSVS